MMKIHAVLLAAAVFAVSSANAEPFNEGGVHYVYEAPAGSYQTRQPSAATTESFYERRADYENVAPADTTQSRPYAEAQSQGTIQQDSYASGNYYPRDAAAGWND